MKCVTSGFHNDIDRNYNIQGSPGRQWCTEGGGVQTPPGPQNSEGPPKSCQTQPECENC